MALLTSQNIDETGLLPTMSAVSGGGDTFQNGGNAFILVKNDNEASTTITPTVVTATVETSQYGQLSKVSLPLVVTAGSIGIVGPFAPGAYNDTSGIMTVVLSVTSSVTIAVLIVENSDI